MITWTVRALSAADIPVLTPEAASTASQKAVPNCEVVALRHHGQIQTVARLGVERQADEATPMNSHERNGLGRGELGGQSEITFVFSIFVIDDDNHLTLTDGFDGLRDSGEWHRVSYLIIE